jgi:hypothetical protein
VQEIEKRIAALHRLYLHRRERGIKGPQIILVIDELNGLMMRLPPVVRLKLSELILTLEGEARKFGMFCMLIGQRWSEQNLGGKPHGAAIRDCLASTIAHRFQSEDQAKKLIGSEYGRRCLSLRNGHYYFRDTDGQVDLVYTPNTLSSDAVLVQQLLDQWREEREAARASERQRMSEQGERETGDVQEERTTWDVVKDHVVMPADQTTQTGPLVEEASVSPNIEKRLRSDDLHIDTLVAAWNMGMNTVSKIETFFRMSHGEAYKAYKRVKAQMGEPVDE